MEQTVIALFDDPGRARAAAEDLAAAGFWREDISLVAPDSDDASGSSATVGAAGGAITGALAGATLGLVGLALPGIGPVLVAGPIAGLLAGAGVGAAAGGLGGALMDLGVPRHRAASYVEGVRRGGTVLCLHSQERAREAARILDVHHPAEIEIRASDLGASWRGPQDASEPRATSERATPPDGDRRGAAEFGRALAHDPRYRDVGWDDVRHEAGTHWEREHGAHTWEHVEDAARDAFERERSAV